MRKILRFRAEDEIDSIKSDIARQMDLEVSKVTFVGIFNQRKTPEIPGSNANHVKIKNFKRSYFQDGMEDMR